MQQQQGMLPGGSNKVKYIATPSQSNSIKMLQPHELIREAIKADTDLMQTIGQRLQATCFEVSPEEPDNTPLPYITIIYGQMQGQQLTKDDLWMPEEWQRTVTVEIAARSTNDVEQLMWRVVEAVARYVDNLADNGEDYPQLNALNATDIAWDWTKPCYYQNLIYQCTIYNV